MRGTSTTSPALAALRAGLAELPDGRLPHLSPADYARSHADFEARSDQRGLLTAWLAARLGPRAATAQPVSVLSVGCGDGSVDAPLADGLTRDRERRVRYVGIDPFAGSTERWRTAMAALDAPGLAAVAVTATFEDAPEEASAFDVISFVHSLYYVDDVEATLARALRQLAPGGEVLVLHAPQSGLNELAGLLAPEVTTDGGHPQWWAETTADAIDRLTGDPTGRAGTITSSAVTLAGRLDLTGCLDPADPVGRGVLDFTVQAVLTDALRPLVLDRLRELALPGPPESLVVEHPLRAWTLRAS